jgi:hypothetical protein
VSRHIAERQALLPPTHSIADVDRWAHRPRLGRRVSVISERPLLTARRGALKLYGFELLKHLEHVRRWKG